MMLSCEAGHAGRLMNMIAVLLLVFAAGVRLDEEVAVPPVSLLEMRPSMLGPSRSEEHRSSRGAAGGPPESFRLLSRQAHMMQSKKDIPSLVENEVDQSTVATTQVTTHSTAKSEAMEAAEANIAKMSAQDRARLHKATAKAKEGIWAEAAQWSATLQEQEESTRPVMPCSDYNSMERCPADRLLPSPSCHWVWAGPPAPIEEGTCKDVADTMLVSAMASDGAALLSVASSAPAESFVLDASLLPPLGEVGEVSMR